ncbi:hypothetical protein VCR15J5_80046 [Vibrio crassostreae]|nr:hypothetical protein VCR15J5_80046 [Vibrio crassostreae]
MRATLLACSGKTEASNGWCGTRSVAGGVFDKINPRVVVNRRLKTLITILLN